MTDVKKAIAQKIGSTAEQKARVWDNLQQKPRKKFTPYALAVTFILIVGLFIASLFPTKDTDPVAIQEEPPLIQGSASVLEEDNSKAVPILSTHTIDMRPISYNEDYAVKLIETEEAYAQIADLYGYKIGNVDFSTESIVYAQFLSDGCGLVVSDVQLFYDQLQIFVDLPEHLRDQEEVSCTDIAKQNTVFLVIPKVEISKAVIIHTWDVFETSFNVVEAREKNELLNAWPITKIKFKRAQDGLTLDVTNKSYLTQITKFITLAEKVPGIANIAQPEWTVTIYGPNDDMKMLYLWFSDDFSSASIVDRANTNTLYTLDETLAPQLFELMQGE